ERAVNSRRLQAFERQERRQDRRQPPGQHGLSGPRTADQKDVMPARGRDDQRPFGKLLAPDIGKIDVILIELVESVGRARRQWLDDDFARQQADGFAETRNTEDSETV